MRNVWQGKQKREKKKKRIEQQLHHIEEGERDQKTHKYT